MSPVSFVKRHWPLFLAPIDSERDPGFYDEILRWNRIGLRVLAALALVGTLLELVITVVVSGWNATWSMVHSRSSSYLVTNMITVALGTTSLISSFFPVGLKHGRLLVSMIALMSLLIRITETFASYEPAMFLAIPLNITLLMFIATGIAPYRFWHAAALGAAFYFVALLGYRHIAPLFELGLETPPQAISFVIVLTFFCVGISELKYRAHYSIYRSKEEIRHYAEVLEKANRELHETQERLVQSEKMAALGRLAAGVAHELNNPVGALNSSSDVSARCVQEISKALPGIGTVDGVPHSPRMEDALRILEENQQIVQRAGKRIAKIVGSLRSFAGLDEAELRRVDVRDGIESAITLLSHLMANRIAVVKEFGDVPRILCYASELNQAFMNILSNACAAIGGTGTIRVATSKDVDGVRIEISDNGKGMAEEELKSLFDFQFSSRRATVRVGMGLKAAYGIIQKHHGSIVVSSVPGKGTKFVITLPIDCNEGVQTLS